MLAHYLSGKGNQDPPGASPNVEAQIWGSCLLFLVGQSGNLFPVSSQTVWPLVRLAVGHAAEHLPDASRWYGQAIQGAQIERMAAADCVQGRGLAPPTARGSLIELLDSAYSMLLRTAPYSKHGLSCCSIMRGRRLSPSATWMIGDNVTKSTFLRLNSRYDVPRVADFSVPFQTPFPSQTALLNVDCLSPDCLSPGVCPLVVSGPCHESVEIKPLANGDCGDRRRTA